MPYRNTYTAEPIRRFNTVEEFDAAQEELEIGQERLRFSGNENVDQSGLNDILRHFSLDKELGFGLTEDGGIPKDANGDSRMYIIKKDAEGNDKLMAYDGHQLEDGTPLEMNSFEFFDQVQMGNVIAYPLGDNAPVQIQLNHRRGRAEFSFSKPLDSEELMKIMDPEPVIPPQPSRFRSLMHRWFGAFDDQFKEREAAENAHKNWKKRTDDICSSLNVRNAKRSLGKVPEEKDAATAKKKAEREAEALVKAQREKQKLADNLRKAREVADRITTGQIMSEAIYEPEPKVISTEETEKLFPGRTVKKDGVHEKLFDMIKPDGEGKSTLDAGFFNSETFADLTVIPKSELDLDSIKVGETGRSITKSEFCNLAMFAAMDPDNAMKAFPESQGYDPTMIPALKEIKIKENGQEKRLFTDKQITQLTASTFNSMYTTDTHMTDPRSKGGVYVKNGIDPARLRVKEALNEYKNGNPDKLGQIIAVGVNEQAANMTQMEDSMGEEMIGGISASKTLVDLMEQDPKLKQAALKAGMNEKSLWVVEGGRELANMYQKGADAALKLAQAAYEGKELPPEEKKAAIKEVIKAKIATESVLLENSQAPSPLRDQVGETLTNGDGPPASQDPTKRFEYYNKDGSLAMPEKGSLYIESGMAINETMKRYYRPAPGSVMFLKTQTGKANLDTIADQIIAEDELLEIPIKELGLKLTYDPGKNKTSYGKRGMKKMAEQGLVTMDLIQELQHEVKTGEAAPKKEEPAKEDLEQQGPAIQHSI